MTEGTIRIAVTGRANAEAKDHEVHLLGLRSLASPRLVVDPDALPEGWQVFTNVDRGNLGRQQYGLRGVAGAMEFTFGDRGRIALLRHAWSGIVEICHGDSVIEIDLFGQEQDVVLVDLPSGTVEPATAETLARLELLVDRDSAPAVERGTGHIAEGELLIRATGAGSPRSHGTQVSVLRVEPMGFGVPTDLSFQTGAGRPWQRMADVDIGGVNWVGGIVADQGDIRLGCEPSAALYLLRHQYAGQVEISYGDQSVRIDLFSPTTGLLEIKVRDLASLEQIGLGDESGDGGPGIQTMQNRTRREHFARLMAGFDTRKPVAIYVPRWHGVAASTRALFDQSLPVPEGHDSHPDDITRDDIEEYAQILVEAGVRHLIISGGDLFNLQIIEAATRLAPQLRVDMLWHSNFLQMNEPHDWNLLRHWLAALQDGTVTRIGVVKEGLEQWFQRIGIDSVFIPNVVPFDIDKVQPTPVDDVVGIWLSGSSSYRKLPHAMLLALRNVPGVTLMGSGLDAQAQRMVQDLRLPFRELSPKPLPQSKLHARMRKTGLSLYVTISECSPMLPLESFGLGVPCLVGPSSHLFVRNKLLSDALIVRRPESPTEIADKIVDGLARREELFSAYVGYYRDEMEMATAGVARLVA
ncbi:MAG: hypothetical protein ABW039_05505 [Sphingobium sp.]